MTWYDSFSWFYDASTEKLYNAVRKTSFEIIKNETTSVLLDLACGTGQNFPHLRNVLEDANIIGLDYSEGMLQKAKRRVENQRWQSIKLIQADARTLSKEQLEHASGFAELDCVVCTLGLSAMPEWETVFQNSFSLLKPGGQYLIMDVWAERRVPQTYWVELIARADLKRKVWQPLEQISENYSCQFLEGSPHVHGGRLFLASGFKSP